MTAPSDFYKVPMNYAISVNEKSFTKKIVHIFPLHTSY